MPSARTSISRLLGAAGRALDQRRGLDTAGLIGGDELGHPHAEHRGYDPSRWLALSTALHGLRTGPEDVFADLGSGKGRVVIQAARRYPFKRVIGVELSDELTRVARANRDRQRRLRCPSVEFVTADLTRWEMAPDLTLAYMYNPLQGATFSAAVQRLLEGVSARRRPLTLLYVNPVEHDRLMATGRIVQLAPPPAVLLRLAGLPAVNRYELRS